MNPMISEPEMYKRLSKAAQRHHKMASDWGVATRMAKDLGIEPSSVSRWRKGVANPTADNLRQLAELYHVSEEYLVGIEEQPGVPREITDLERRATEIIWRAARYSSNLPVPNDAGQLFGLVVEYLADGKSKEEALGKVLSMLEESES